MSADPGPSVYVGADSPLARQMGLCKGGDGFWCGALINNGASHREGCPQALVCSHTAEHEGWEFCACFCHDQDDALCTHGFYSEACGDCRDEATEGAS